MNKDLEYIELFELYKDLLTEKQRELFASHYLFDLSLSEIAEQDGGSRQSVYDTVKKVKKKLLTYENSLKIRAKNAKLKQLANVVDSELSRQILEIIDN